MWSLLYSFCRPIVCNAIVRISGFGIWSFATSKCERVTTRPVIGWLNKPSLSPHAKHIPRYFFKTYILSTFASRLDIHNLSIYYKMLKPCKRWHLKKITFNVLNKGYVWYGTERCVVPGVHPMYTYVRIWALSYFCDMTLSQEFKPMGAQLSLKASLPLAERIATASDRCSKTWPWITITR